MFVRVVPMATVSEQDIYELLQGDFRRRYGELVAVTGEKPSQIIFELEAVLGHIAVAKTTPKVADENIKASFKHMQRATLDASKMLWLYYKSQLERLASDDKIGRFCTKCSEEEFAKSLRNANKVAIDARMCELNNVGIDPVASLDRYYDAAMACKEALDKIDLEKLGSFRRFRIRHKFIDQAIAFFVGVFASVVAMLIFS